MRKVASLSVATAMVIGAGVLVFTGSDSGTAPAPRAATFTSGSVNAASQTSRETVALVRKFHAAFARGDLSAAQKFVSDDFVMHVPGRGLGAGQYWGKEGLRGFMGPMFSYNGGTFDLAVPHFAVNGDTAFTREVLTVNRKMDPEKTWVLRFAMQYKINGGRISEAWTMPEEQDVYDAYWTPSHDTPRGIPVSSKPAPGPPDARHAISPENTAFLNVFYAMVRRGDLGGLRRMISDKVEVRMPGHCDISGVYKGWDGFLAFRKRMMGAVGDRYKLDVPAMAGDSAGGFAREFIRMSHPWDPEVKPVEVTVYYTIRDNKVVMMQGIPVDTYAWQDFFTNPHKDT
ncbi:nuclear transport factor 2 family protein [Streptomyces sp. NPDC048231]|uniref:nuclear transport factor 2 family protein n=1 Tax=unclassified Streptomyces TaxID=2593676 RepID=UPI003631F83E